ncbi:hypothetical protein MSG37_03810 [Shewanella sp. 1CM18E]|uniref:hypothetical protein n=1 Tax=Shewanella sp. 1CM18E TaxID=2929169 RepID=UPI0020BEE47C|nr:hypothetical protein [Shewanella sp. 1CM18E]MCK8043999.1 hypothetical protein [Shewanella sp. 1CM18E]
MATECHLVTVVPMACGQRMCRHFRDTQQVHPWRLGHDVHVMDGHGRIYTSLEKRNL